MSTLPEDFVREGAKEKKETQSCMADFPSWLLDVTDEDMMLSFFQSCLVNLRGETGKPTLPARAVEEAVTAKERAAIATANRAEREGICPPAEANPRF